MAKPIPGREMRDDPASGARGCGKTIPKWKHTAPSMSLLRLLASRLPGHLRASVNSWFGSRKCCLPLGPSLPRETWPRKAGGS